MIDLHMHTTYSDGKYSVLELIDILNAKKINYASITDHNSVDAHIEFEQKEYQRKFNGKMIRGVEVQTIVNDYLIEVLIYNYDLDSLKKYIDNTRRMFWHFHENAYQKLLEIAQNMGLKYIEPKRNLENGYYCNMKFQEAIGACLDENKKIVSERILTDILYFYRHEFQNINSPFYIDNKKAFPALNEVIEVAHECGGIILLAHIDEYQAIPNKEEFLEFLFKNYNLDGLECFHPSISKENRVKYMDFALRNNLLISAGSDFHSPHLEHRKNIDTEATLNEVTVLRRIK